VTVGETTDSTTEDRPVGAGKADLAALADTFVPGPDAPRRAALAAERIDRNLEGGQARQLRWALNSALAPTNRIAAAA